MKILLRFFAIFNVGLKRLLAQRGLALATLVGLFIAAALVMSIPIYADGIYQRMLVAEFDRRASAKRPPFAFMFRHIGSWSGSVPVDSLKPVDDYLSNVVQPRLGLASELFVRYLKSDNMRLYPATGKTYTSTDKPLEWIAFGTVSDLAEHIQLVEGQFPPEAPADREAPVPILVNETLATMLGLQPGEEYIT